MKRNIKNFLKLILIFAILANIIINFINPIYSYAVSNNSTIEADNSKQEDYNNTTEKSSSSSSDSNKKTDSQSKKASDGSSYFEKFVNGAAGLILYPIKILPLLLGKIIQAVMGIFTGNNGTLSVEDILFNRLDITKIDFFNMSTGNEVVDTIRKNVAIWYYSLRNISAAILIAILIYVGLRMALSTIADEKARYSEMLVNWVISIALLFVLHYIIELVIVLNNQIVDILSNNIDRTDPVDKIFINAWSVGFVEGFGNAICYLILVIMTLVFLLSYLKRMITIGFLIVIAPLVTITYSIDKMGDNRSQALDSWFKEFVYNILIQPFQCVTYIVLASSAMKILDNDTSLAAMIIAIMMLLFIYESERIIRHIFHFEARTMAETVSHAALVGSTLGTLAKGGRKIANLSSEEMDAKTYKNNKEYYKMKKGSQESNSNGDVSQQNNETSETINQQNNQTNRTHQTNNEAYINSKGKTANANPHKKNRKVGKALSTITNNKLFQEYTNTLKTGSKMLLGGSFTLATGSPATFLNTEANILKNGISDKNDYIEKKNKQNLKYAYQEVEDEARETMINNRIIQKMNVDNLNDLDEEQRKQEEKIREEIEQTDGDNITEEAKKYVALRANEIIRGDNPKTEAEENMKDTIDVLKDYYKDNGMEKDYINVQVSEDLSDIRKKEKNHKKNTGENKVKFGAEASSNTNENKPKKYYRKK